MAQNAQRAGARARQRERPCGLQRLQRRQRKLTQSKLRQQGRAAAAFCLVQRAVRPSSYAAATRRWLLISGTLGQGPDPALAPGPGRPICIWAAGRCGGLAGGWRSTRRMYYLEYGVLYCGKKQEQKQTKTAPLASVDASCISAAAVRPSNCCCCCCAGEEALCTNNLRVRACGVSILLVPKRRSSTHTKRAFHATTQRPAPHYHSYTYYTPTPCSRTFSPRSRPSSSSCACARPPLQRSPRSLGTQVYLVCCDSTFLCCRTVQCSAATCMQPLLHSRAGPLSTRWSLVPAAEEQKKKPKLSERLRPSARSDPPCETAGAELEKARQSQQSVPATCVSGLLTGSATTLLAARRIYPYPSPPCLLAL